MAKKECPLLEKCLKAFGIDCKNRDFTKCNLYNNLLRDRQLAKTLKKPTTIGKQREKEKTVWEKYLKNYKERHKDG